MAQPQNPPANAAPDTLLVADVQPALAHALPFRVLFEEHLRRRPAELLKQADRIFKPVLPDTPLNALRTSLTAQETAYTALQKTSEEVREGKDLKLDGCLKVCFEADRDLKLLLHRMDSSALCLSGGGIRSASFCLGVLEGLARYSRRGSRRRRGRGLLKELDYLSTVSGGGYIGSWMMAWVYRRKMTTQKPWTQAFGEVVSALAGDANVTAGDPEPLPVRHLRSYTSFLAPELGMTLDTFTLAAIILRNLMVNWAMLIPVLIALISFAESSAYLVQWCTGPLRHGFGVVLTNLPWALGQVTWGGLAIGGCFGLAAWAAGKVLPSHRKPDAGDGNKLVGLFVASVLAGCWLIAVSTTETHSAGIFWSQFSIALLGFLLLGIAIVVSYRRRMLNNGAGARMASAVLMVVIAAPVAAAASGGLLYWLQACVFGKLSQPPAGTFWAMHGSDHRLFTIFAVPIVMLALTLTTTLFSALMGLFETEDDREWWVRCGGAFLAFGLGWMVVHGIALYGRGGLLYINSGIAGLVLGLAGSSLGYSTATAATTRVSTEQVGKVGKFLARHSLLLPSIGGISLLLITLGMVTVEEALRRSLAVHWFEQAAPAYLSQGLRSATLLLALAAVLACLINLAININLFSLHGMYRMRLMRAFLGASNVFRHPDPFTQFDWRDTPYETDLPCDEGAPIHIVNTTLNLAGTKNAAWRQRKGGGFSFSPVCCGGWRVGYVKSNVYGGSKGATLATAMAISGAAADPNMGYQTSPLLALLMTFFNLRLGCWMPNPARAATLAKPAQTNFLRSAGPRFALWPLFAEALGSTDDRYKWIELTDGGHFENLALYEMVLRRCKHIVVVDAGADPNFGFDDLGNAVRKIQIDLGVTIEFDTQLKMQPGTKADNQYCAVGRIRYDCIDLIDGVRPEDLVGHLVYIKTVLNGSEPADIVQYARTHHTFPHETTANQFFNEPQFESYRHLGSFAVDRIAQSRPPGSGFGMRSFYAAAQQYCATPVPVPQTAAGGAVTP